MDIVAFHVHHLPLKSCMQGTLKRSLFPFLYITFHVVNALCSKHKLVALNVLLVAVCHILVPWMLVGTAQCHQCWPCHHHSEPKVGEMNECFSCKLKKKILSIKQGQDQTIIKNKVYHLAWQNTPLVWLDTVSDSV